MGAILYGGTDKDVLYLNDITLWTGEPDRKVTTPDPTRLFRKSVPCSNKEDSGEPTVPNERFKDTTSEKRNQPLGQTFHHLVLPNRLR